MTIVANTFHSLAKFALWEETVEAERYVMFEALTAALDKGRVGLETIAWIRDRLPNPYKPNQHQH